MNNDNFLRVFVFTPTEEYRRPKKNEWYMAYNDWPAYATSDMDHEYYILSVTIKPYEGKSKQKT